MNQQQQFFNPQFHYPSPMYQQIYYGNQQMCNQPINYQNQQYYTPGNPNMNINNHPPMNNQFNPNQVNNYGQPCTPGNNPNMYNHH